MEPWATLGVRAPKKSRIMKLANKPFALAPGMGLNSFFAVVVGNIAAMTGMTYVASFQAALVIILVEGIVFIQSSENAVRTLTIQHFGKKRKADFTVICAKHKRLTFTPC